MAQFIVKLIVSVLAGAYGVYATLNDFHEEKHHKKVLNRAGKRGIAFLIVVTALGLGVDSWKEIDAAKKEKEGLKSASETAQELKDVLNSAKETTGKLDSVLTEAQRAADPLDDSGWKLELRLDAPPQPSIASYWSRVRQPNTTSTFYLPNPHAPQKQVPSEAPVANLARFPIVEITLRKNMKEPNVVYGKTLRCEESVMLTVSDTKGISIGCTTNIDLTRGKQLKSYGDLNAMTTGIKLDVEEVPGIPRTEYRDIDFTVSGRLIAKAGRSCWFRNVERVACPNYESKGHKWACFTTSIECQ